jgi:hypothetical protein
VEEGTKSISDATRVDHASPVWRKRL